MSGRTRSSSGVRSTVLAHPAVRWGFIVGTALSLFVGAVVPSSHLSVLTDLSVPVGPFGIRTWLHFLGYATLGVVVAFAAKGSELEYGLALSLGGVVTYGLLVETLHAAVPYRTFSGLDIAANGLGAFVGVGFAWLLVHVGSRCLHHGRRRTYRR